MPVLLMNQLGFLVMATFQVMNTKPENYQLFYGVNLCYLVYCFLECEYCCGILLKEIETRACEGDATHVA